MGGSIKSKLPKKVAVTGGIASGKSTVCHLFEKLGAFIVSADEIVHQLLVPSSRIGQEMIALLGPDIVEGATLSRKRIAQKVFHDPVLLQAVEKVIHPEVQRIIEAEYKHASKTHAALFVAEVPLLYEAGLEDFYDVVIVVMSNKQFRASKEDDLRRSQRLMPIEQKIKKADLVIKNNGSLEDLFQTIQTSYNALKENI